MTTQPEAGAAPRLSDQRTTHTPRLVRDVTVAAGIPVYLRQRGRMTQPEPVPEYRA